jgi:hypothetical protein
MAHSPHAFLPLTIASQVFVLCFYYFAQSFIVCIVGLNTGFKEDSLKVDLIAYLPIQYSVLKPPCPFSLLSFAYYRSFYIRLLHKVWETKLQSSTSSFWHMFWFRSSPSSSPSNSANKPVVSASSYEVVSYQFSLVVESIKCTYDSHFLTLLNG